MVCLAKEELEQHLSDIRSLAARHGLTAEEKKACARAEEFAIGMLKEHDVSGHAGKRCPFATLIYYQPPTINGNHLSPNRLAESHHMMRTRLAHTDIVR